ncbi:hypothetical protein N9L68_04425 [bacterium]|nr:hypothetical protein [bacterium]
MEPPSRRFDPSATAGTPLEELDASSVEEVVRRSLHEGCPRFEFLEVSG